MASSDFQLPTPSPHVVFKKLDEGGVLLSTVDEVYFGVNMVGARIWSLLPPATRRFSELCTILATEYPDVTVDRIRRDAQAFLAAVVDAGLAITPEGDTRDGSMAPSTPPR